MIWLRLSAEAGADALGLSSSRSAETLLLATKAYGVAKKAKRGKISVGVWPEMTIVTPRKRAVAAKASARAVCATEPSAGESAVPSPKRTEKRPLLTVTTCFSDQMTVPPSWAS